MLAYMPSKRADAASASKAKPKRKGVAVNVRIDPELHAAMFRWIESQRVPPQQTDFITIAVREFLEREKAWPPSNDR